MISRALLLRLQHSPIANSSFHNLNRLSSSYSSSPPSSTAAATVSDGGSGGANAGKCARPSTISWSMRLHNSVKFIGTVEYPIKQYANNNNNNNGPTRFGVFTILRVKTSPDSSTSFRITLEMWDELAERALLHLRPNDYIYISGELGSYTKATSEGTESLRYKVTAKELNYVKLDEPGKNFLRVVNSGIENGKDLGESSKSNYSNRLHLWQIFFANPDEWYDNRKSKKNPKKPDFKHKSTGEALWFNASDPPWVNKQLEILDSRSSGTNNDVTSKFSPSRWVSDEELMLPDPTVMAKELNYIKLDEPQTNFQRVVNSGNETGEDSGKSGLPKYSNRLHLWEKFFANPNEWYDNRKSKKNPKQPDFKHKSTGEALWSNASDPPWVKEQVEMLDSTL